MEKGRFVELLAKKLSDSGSAADTEALKKVLEENEQYNNISSVLSNYSSLQEPQRPITEKLRLTWQQIAHVEKQHTEPSFDFSTQNKTWFNPNYLIKIAALVLLISGAAIIVQRLWLYTSDQNFLTISSTNQKTFKVLEDGTKIWLNKSSEIRFNKAFGKTKRQIFLEGEAYFDVAENKQVPLTVQTGQVAIEVKGTAFNVNAYKTNPEIEVALIRGSIEVIDHLNTRRILLKPNQKLTFLNHTLAGTANFNVISLPSYLLLRDTKWTADTLTFQKEKLKDLVLRMEKKYDLKIEIHSSQLQEKRFSGRFTNETIQQALEALKISYPLTYTMSNRLVLIKE